MAECDKNAVGTLGRQWHNVQTDSTCGVYKWWK